MVTRLPWEPQFYVNDSSVLSPIEVISGVKLLSMIGTSHIPHCHGNQVMMAIVVILE